MFVPAGTDPFSMFEYEKYHCLMKHHRTGEVLRDDRDMEVPKNWAVNSRKVLVDKYFRKAGVPVLCEFVEDTNLPRWVWRSRSVGEQTCGETSVKQVIHRVVGHWTYEGLLNHYFDASNEQAVSRNLTSFEERIAVRDENAKAFYDEHVYILLNQMGAPNSPQFFNTGLWWAYGIEGKGQGHYFVDKSSNTHGYRTDSLTPINDHNKLLASSVKVSPTAYSRVQVSACFIVGLKDTMTDGESGILDWFKTEGLIFKYGSGCGTNVSPLRGAGEKLSGGGKSSGVMSWMRTADYNAGAIKSGGTCLAPYTYVYTENGPVQVQELVGRPFIALSYDPPAGRYKAKNATAWSAGTKRVVRVVTDKGQFDVTFDHPMRLSTGEYVHAEKLRVGQSLFACAVDQRSNDGFDISTFDKYIAARKEKHGYPPAVSEIKESIERRFVSYDGYLAELKANNHLVVSVETIGEMEVFDVEVECPTADDHSPQTGHNFVIWPNDQLTGSGVVVSNTRRAAKLIAMDLDHPDIEKFIACKQMSEIAAADLVTGSEIITNHCQALMLAMTDIKTHEQAMATPVIVQLMEKASAAGVCHNYIDKAIRLALNGEVEWPGTVFNADYEGQAYEMVPFQNANNSVQVPSEFYKAVDDDAMWKLTARTTGEEFKRLNARDLEHQIAKATWFSGDPGMQYSTTINDWNVTPKDGRINASNPCVTGDTRIITINGTFSIRELVGKEDVDVLAGDFSFRRATRIVSNGVKPVFRLKTETGYELDLTADHRVATANRGDVEAQHLTTRDELITNTPRDANNRDFFESLTPLGEQEVFDLTEPVTSHFVANGIVVHNCSEHLRLDNSACNLASLRIMRFVDDHGDIIPAEFAHAARLYTIALDISNSMAHFPTKAIAVGAYNYRDIGLGYCDLGAFIMANGAAYSSNKGRALAALVTAALHANALATSVEMAKELGAYPRYWDNQNEHQQCVQNHISAFCGTHTVGVTNKPQAFIYGDLQCDSDGPVNDLVHQVEKTFLKVRDEGKLYGHRNAEATLLAPTGTIGILMGCDTTGVEPMLGLRVQKTLAGGGTMTMTPATAVEMALEKLYPDDQVRIDKILDNLERDGRIDVGEGLLDPNHAAIFQTAFPNFPGDTAIEWGDHVRMMAAVQPFLSGAISKSINMPADATIDDVKKAFRMGHDLGVKSLAIYRDGSKLSQPLNIEALKKKENPKVYTSGWVVSKPPPAVIIGTDMGKGDSFSVETKIYTHTLPTEVQPEVKKDSKTNGHHKRGERVKLGWNRKPGIDVRVTLGMANLYVRTTRYDDGKTAEIWATYGADQGLVQALLGAFCKQMNIGLQCGVPLSVAIRSMLNTNFEPKGQVHDHPYIKTASSILNLLGRILDYHELNNTDLLNIQPGVAVAPEAEAALEAVARDDPRYANASLTGENCPACGSIFYIQSGANCKKCLDCGSAGGCG